MDKHSWEKAKKILPIAMGLSFAERDVYLDEVCGEDETLRHEIESLLAADLDRVAFLETPLLRILDLPPASEGRIIGAYRIIQELGHGGMGTVYLAARADKEFEGHVALKVLRLSHTIPEIEWRFRQEIQILANLNHPNIARLYEVGRTEEGSPYFIMEYIDGLPIARFCIENGLSVEECLTLFQKVCGAVEYAHQNLVVHRDLKPSNILITPAGEPKLLDFGIAKLLQPIESSGPATVAGFHFFTPEYASPEQVSEAQIATTSDVYSLGVILYELLTGRLPYSLKGHPAKEIRRIVCEQEPEAPSRAFEPSPSEEVNQHQKARKLRRRLRGEIDNIVLMALRKEASQRYNSVGEFARDIDAHLHGFSVVAQRSSWGYRAFKFIRRNRLAVALTATVILLSLGFGILMTIQQRQTARERDRAEQISEFMIGVFGVAGPRESPGKRVTARSLLDQGAKEISQRFLHQPELRADLLETIGRSYNGLGLYSTSLPIHKEVLEIRRDLFGEQHPKTARSLNNVTMAFYRLSDFDEAEAYANKALQTWRQVKDPDHLGLATSLTHLGLIRRAQGDYKAAEKFHREALRIRRNAMDEETVSESVHNLAAVLQYQQNYREAIPIAREAVSLDRRINGNIHPDTLVSLDGLAKLLRHNGDFEEAEKIFNEAVSLGRRLYPEGHSNLATVLNDYALLKSNKGDYRAAEALYRESLAIGEKFNGREHPDVAITIKNLAIALRAQERFAEAEPLYREALELQIRHYGSHHPDVLVSKAAYSEFLWAKGEKTEAAELLESVIAERRQYFDDTAPVIATDLHNLAFIKEMQGQFSEAEKLAREALARDRRTFKLGHPNIVRSLHRLASILGKTERPKECEVLIREALQYLPTQIPVDHWRIAEAESVLGGCLAGQRRYKEAEPLLLKSYARLNQDRGPKSWQTQGALRRLVQFYDTTNHPAESAKHRASLSDPQ